MGGKNISSFFAAFAGLINRQGNALCGSWALAPKMLNAKLYSCPILTVFHTCDAPSSRWFSVHLGWLQLSGALIRAIRNRLPEHPPQA
jgi:hypothetical protein